MCAGAAYWAGIGRVVYGLGERELKALTGDHPENPTLDLSCRTVLAAGQRSIDVVGPLLADEAAALHDGVWGRAGGPAATGTAAGSDGLPQGGDRGPGGSRRPVPAP